jgi:hypothetical protein
MFEQKPNTITIKDITNILSGIVEPSVKTKNIKIKPKVNKDNKVKIETNLPELAFSLDDSGFEYMNGDDNLNISSSIENKRSIDDIEVPILEDRYPSKDVIWT